MAETTLLFLDAPRVDPLGYRQWDIPEMFCGLSTPITTTRCSGTRARITTSSHFLKFDQPVEGLEKQRVAVAFPLDFLPGVSNSTEANRSRSSSGSSPPHQDRWRSPSRPRRRRRAFGSTCMRPSSPNSAGPASRKHRPINPCSSRSRRSRPLPCTRSAIFACSRPTSSPHCPIRRTAFPIVITVSGGPSSRR